MASKNEIVVTMAEAAAVLALVGAGGIALPVAAAAYGIWRFIPDSAINKATGKKGEDE